MAKRDGPARRSGATRLANSQISGRVSRGSMISSIRNASAVRNGERTWFRRPSISLNKVAGSSDFSRSDL